MKRILLFAGLLLVIFSASAQSIEKYYTSRQINSGLLFFIWEQKGFEDKDCKMIYDQTLIDCSDTVRLGISFNLKVAVKVDSIFICRGTEVNGFAFDRHYLDPQGKFYNYRGFVALPRPKMEQLYAETTPPVFRFTGEGKSFDFQIKPKQWEKLRLINERIYQLLRINSK